MVSLVMPAWKPNPFWLGEAVRSALGQLDCSIELVVVDDGSPEPVAALLEEFDDPRLVIVGAPHGGPCRARNVGIDRATGDAIRFIDADDVLEPASTARLLRLSEPDGAIAYGSTLVCDPELRPQRLIESTVQGDILLDCVLGRFDARIVSILFPRQVVTATGEWDPDLVPNADWDYVLRAVEHAPVRGERVVTARYRRHEASITARADVAKKKNMQVLDRVFARHPELSGTRLERVSRARLHIGAATQLASARRYGAMPRELASALRLNPRATAPVVVRMALKLPRVAARRGSHWVAARTGRAEA